MHRFLLAGLWACSLIWLPFVSLIGQVFEIKEDHQWGFVDAKGEVVVPARYDFVFGDTLVSRPEQGYFVVRQGKYFGLCHRERGDLMAATYPLLRMRGKIPGGLFVEVKDGDQYGLFDTLGNELVPVAYEAVDDLAPGIYRVRKGGKWGLYARQAPHRLPAAFASMSLSGARFVVGRNERGFSAWEIGRGQLVEDCPDSLSYLPNGLAQRWQWQPDTTQPDSLEAGAWCFGLASREGAFLSAVTHKAARAAHGWVRLQAATGWALYDDQGRQELPPIYEGLHIDASGLIWFRQEAHWGLYDPATDSVRFPAVLSLPGEFAGPVAIVNQNGRLGLINRQGELLAPVEYDRIVCYAGGTVRLRQRSRWSQLVHDEQGQLQPKRRLVIRRSEAGEQQQETNWQDVDPVEYGWFQDREGRWGLRDSAGSPRIRPQFDEVYVLPQRGLSLVIYHQGSLIHRRCGLVHHPSGRVIIAPKYNMLYLGDFQENPIARVQFHNGGFGLVDYRGRARVLPRTGYISPFEAGVARYYEGYERASLVKRVGEQTELDPQQGSWGLVSIRKGFQKTDALFAEIRPPQQGVIPIRSGREWGALDLEFDTLLSARFQAVEVLSATGREGAYRGPGAALRVERKARRFFYLDTLGRLLFTCDGWKSGDFHDGRARFQFEKSEKWGYIDREGQAVISLRYEKAQDFSEGLAAVKHGMRWGYIDTTGKWVIPATYYAAGPFRDGLARVKKGSRYGYLDRSGAFHLRPRYRRASDFEGGRAIVRKGKRYGLIDQQGQWVVRPRYQRINRVGDLYKVKRKGRYGLIDPAGKVLARTRYAQMGEDFFCRRIRVRMGRYFGFLNERGEEVIPTEYRLAGDFTPEGAPVQGNQGWGLVDTLGNFTTTFRGGSRQIIRRQIEHALSTKALEEEEEAQALVHLLAPDFWNSYLPYEQVAAPSEGIMVARSEKLYGLAGLSGNLLVEPECEAITTRDGWFRIVKQGNIGYLSPEGAWLYPVE